MTTIVIDVNEFDSTVFADWLKTQMAEKRITNSELAVKSGVSRQYIYMLTTAGKQLLTGKATQPALDKVEKIARALGCDIEEARRAAGYSSAIAPSELSIGPNVFVNLKDRDLTETEQREIAEELSLAYEVILKRRELRKARASE